MIVPLTVETPVNYVETLRSLKRRDDWERSGSPDDAARWDLRRMHSLLARLGDPHLGRRTIHVAGSKAKGSVATMIASVLRAAGAPTGLHTSPHLHRFTERVVVGDEAISEDDFCRLMGELMPHIEAEDEDAAREIAEENDGLEWSEPDYQQFDDYEVEVDEET